MIWLIEQLKGPIFLKQARVGLKERDVSKRFENAFAVIETHYYLTMAKPNLKASVLSW
jgi:hypothetical protein